MCGNASNAINQDSYRRCATSAEAADAASALARLMERQLGYSVGHMDPIALRLFIRAYWSRVSAFAHTIHDEQ